MDRGRLYLIFEYLTVDLRRYMDHNGKTVGLPPNIVKVTSLLLFKICVVFYVSNATRFTLLSRKTCSPPRFETPEHPCWCWYECYKIGWFRLGQIIRVPTSKDDSWGNFLCHHRFHSNSFLDCHPLVSRSRNSLGRKHLLFRRGYVVYGLYVCGNGDRRTTIPWRLRDRSVV